MFSFLSAASMGQAWSNPSQAKPAHLAVSINQWPTFRFSLRQAIPLPFLPPLTHKRRSAPTPKKKSDGHFQQPRRAVVSRVLFRARAHHYLFVWLRSSYTQPRCMCLCFLNKPCRSLTPSSPYLIPFQPCFPHPSLYTGAPSLHPAISRKCSSFPTSGLHMPRPTCAPRPLACLVSSHIPRQAPMLCPFAAIVVSCG